MRITSLKIKGYKNIINETLIDFSTATNYVALIGLNGSGKSNIIEAISLIFSSLYYEKPSPFEYEIKYTINGANINIKNGALDAYGITIPKKDHNLYLPSNVISSYSGEELRMWEEIYLESYSIFFQDIKKQSGFVPDLLYVNKYSWSIGLIALLCSENVTVCKFVKGNLHIPDDVILKFDINKENYPLYEGNAALSLIKRLVELQDASADGTIHINEIKTLDIGQKNDVDFVQKLFYYLFITAMPVKGDKIKADKIIRKIEISFNKTDIKKLSEGEKKLILLYTITQLLANDKSLILLDEPDAHLHIDRKKEIIDIVDQKDQFTLFTTHSPTILHCIRDENVRIIKTTEPIGLEAIYLDKLKALENLTNGGFSLIDATLVISTKKPLLLVEGKGDVAYVFKAINVLNQQNELDIDILPFGGTANAKDFVDEIKKCVPPEKLIIVLFDRDEAGKDGMKKCVNFSKGKGNTSTFKKDDIIYLMLPIQPAHNGNDFLIEDYFSNAKKNAIATQCIADANGSFNDFPKDLKQRIKDKLITEIDTYTAADLAGFQTLLDKLKNIIQGTEVFESELSNKPGN